MGGLDRRGRWGGARWTGSIWIDPSYIFRVCFFVIRYCLVVGGENEYCSGGVWLPRTVMKVEMIFFVL